MVFILILILIIFFIILFLNVKKNIEPFWSKINPKPGTKSYVAVEEWCQLGCNNSDCFKNTFVEDLRKTVVANAIAVQNINITIDTLNRKMDVDESVWDGKMMDYWGREKYIVSKKTFDEELNEKVDNTSVTELGLNSLSDITLMLKDKVKKTYVETKLKEKADSDWVNSMLTNKANKRYVNNKISNLVKDTDVNQELKKKLDQSAEDWALTKCGGIVKRIQWVLDSPSKFMRQINNKAEKKAMDDELQIRAEWVKKQKASFNLKANNTVLSQKANLEEVNDMLNAKADITSLDGSVDDQMVTMVNSAKSDIKTELSNLTSLEYDIIKKSDVNGRELRGEGLKCKGLSDNDYKLEYCPLNIQNLFTIPMSTTRPR